MSKQNSVLRLTQLLHNTPHLITPTAFEVISNYLILRNSGQLMKMENNTIPVNNSPDVVNSIGIIDINTALTYKTQPSMCGETGVSYESILSQVEYYIDNGATTIVYNIDSGGGEAYNAFSFANQARALCDANNVKLVSYVDGCAASAAYAWAITADEVIANPMSEVGSIGVLIALMNNSEMLKQNGIQRTFISAGKDKIPFAEDGSFKQSFLDDLQAKVDVLYQDFVNHVSAYTGLSSEAIKSTEAKTFLAPEALKLGLINKIMTNNEFLNYITGALDA